MLPLANANIPMRAVNLASEDSRRFDFTDKESRIRYINTKLNHVKDLRYKVAALKIIAVDEYQCSLDEDVDYTNLSQELDNSMISGDEVRRIRRGYTTGRHQDSIMVRIYGKILRLSLIFNHIVLNMSKKAIENSFDETNQATEYNNPEAQAWLLVLKTRIQNVFSTYINANNLAEVKPSMAIQHFTNLTNILQHIKEEFTEDIKEERVDKMMIKYGCGF